MDKELHASSHVSCIAVGSHALMPCKPHILYIHYLVAYAAVVVQASRSKTTACPALTFAACATQWVPATRTLLTRSGAKLATPIRCLRSISGQRCFAAWVSCSVSVSALMPVTWKKRKTWGGNTEEKNKKRVHWGHGNLHPYSLLWLVQYSAGIQWKNNVGQREGMPPPMFSPQNFLLSRSPAIYMCGVWGRVGCMAW